MSNQSFNELNAKALYTQQTAIIGKPSDEVWEFLKQYNWINEDETTDEVLSVSINRIKEYKQKPEGISPEHEKLFGELLVTLDRYFYDPDIVEIRVFRMW